MLPEKNKVLRELKERIDDTYAWGILRSLIDFDYYVPVTSSAIKPMSLATVLNDILINGRTSILEFGSGLSTIAIAKLLKKSELTANFVSIESDEKWLEIVRSWLDRENLSGIVTLVHAPLAPVANQFENNQWYCQRALAGLKNTKYDLVLVDGPPAWSDALKYSRFQAMPFIAECLAENWSFYLDDADRCGEQKIVKLWEKQYGIKFRKLSHSLAIATKGMWLNCVL